MTSNGIKVLVFITLMSRCALATAGSENGREQLFSLVIGSNTTGDTSVAPLRYADDDAAQNAKLLRQLGAQVILLASFDPETRSLHPNIKPAIPTRTAVFAAMEKLNIMMEEAKAMGQVPIFYLFYSGHGDVEHNQGFMHLQNEKFWRKDLIKILKSSKALTNHVIIDACKSYFMVFERGTGGSRTSVQGVLDLDDEAIPDNTGVFLSTSSARQSHEWSAFQAGIFSHEIRSALRGAADLNVDGSISYKEAGAFVWKANSSISNHQFRPEFFSRPPGNSNTKSAILMNLTDASGDRLFLGPGAGYHAYIEDSDGLRLADFHPSESQELVLLLPKHRPLFVRLPGSNEEFELPSGPEIHFDNIPSRPSTVVARGAEHIAFAKLFFDAFEKSSITEYETRPVLVVGEETKKRNLKGFRLSLGVSSLIIGLTGGILTGLAVQQSNNVTPLNSGLERQQVNDRIDNLNLGAVVCYSVAGSAFISYLIWTLWPEEKLDIKVMVGNVHGLELSVDF